MVCLITILKGNVKVFVWIQEKVGEYSTDVYNITNLTLNVRKRSVLFSFTVFCVGMSFFAEIFMSIAQKVCIHTILGTVFFTHCTC